MTETPSYITTCSEDEDGNVVLDIPEELIEALGWGEGTVLDISALPGSIVLRKVEPADAPPTGLSPEGECSAE
jgi:bifunctional DNA-binding transcriptional regulator/antitoxin component of YhaV-PrlF toxin-antitoxin module